MPTRQINDSIRSASNSDRSRQAVIATDNPVQVYDHGSRAVIEEVLRIDGATWRDPAPLLRDHVRGIPEMAGSVTAFRREAGRLAATLRFATGPQAADEAWNLVQQGHAKSVSVGYRVIEATDIPTGQTATVAGKSYTAGKLTLRVVTRWEVREVSLVPIGADEAAQIRSDSTFNRSSSTMSITTAISTREMNMRFADLAAARLRGRGETVPSSPHEACRAAFSSVSGYDELGDMFKTMLLDGWRQGVDSLAGIVTTVDAPNYLTNELAAVTVHPRMEPIGRGGVAPSVSFGVGSNEYRLMRFGFQFSIDEQDMVEGAEIGVYQTVLYEAMRAARALVVDLQWSVLLSNPDAADGTPLFHSSRGNLSTDALDATGLNAAIGVIAGQTGVDSEVAPVHWNQSARYLIVPPTSYGTARGLARDLALNDSSDLIVRSESRLSSVGVLDPRDGDTLLQGNGTNWMMAAPASQKASIVLALLNGQAEPTIRYFELDQGEWGLAFDVSFSCACAAMAGEPVYWSTGEGE